MCVQNRMSPFRCPYNYDNTQTVMHDCTVAVSVNKNLQNNDSRISVLVAADVAKCFFHCFFLFKLSLSITFKVSDN